MGWNQGYSIFEATVVGAYDLGKLDKNLLAVLMEPYRESDIDGGGKRGLRSQDGKDVEEIVCEIWGLPLPPRPDTDPHIGGDEWEEYWEGVYEQFKTVRDHFGWE
jgi:hypothetical protein